MDTTKRHPNGPHCECCDPEHSGVWVEYGTRAAHTQDIELCGRCGAPILGTQATHHDAEDGD